MVFLAVMFLITSAVAEAVHYICRCSPETNPPVPSASSVSERQDVSESEERNIEERVFVDVEKPSPPNGSTSTGSTGKKHRKKVINRRRKPGKIRLAQGSKSIDKKKKQKNLRIDRTINRTRRNSIENDILISDPIAFAKKLGKNGNNIDRCQESEFVKYPDTVSFLNKFNLPSTDAASKSSTTIDSKSSEKNPRQHTEIEKIRCDTSKSNPSTKSAETEPHYHHDNDEDNKNPEDTSSTNPSSDPCMRQLKAERSEFASVEQLARVLGTDSQIFGRTIFDVIQAPDGDDCNNRKTTDGKNASAENAVCMFMNGAAADWSCPDSVEDSKTQRETSATNQSLLRSRFDLDQNKNHNTATIESSNIGQSQSQSNAQQDIQRKGPISNQTQQRESQNKEIRKKQKEVVLIVNETVNTNRSTSLDAASHKRGKRRKENVTAASNEPRQTETASKEFRKILSPSSGPGRTGTPLSEPRKTGTPFSESRKTGTPTTEPRKTGVPTTEPRKTRNPSSEPRKTGTLTSESLKTETARSNSSQKPKTAARKSSLAKVVNPSSPKTDDNRKPIHGAESHHLTTYQQDDPHQQQTSSSTKPLKVSQAKEEKTKSSKKGRLQAKNKNQDQSSPMKHLSATANQERSFSCFSCSIFHRSEQAGHHSQKSPVSKQQQEPRTRKAGSGPPIDSTQPSSTATQSNNNNTKAATKSSSKKHQQKHRTSDDGSPQPQQKHRTSDHGSQQFQQRHRTNDDNPKSLHNKSIFKQDQKRSRKLFFPSSDNPSSSNSSSHHHQIPLKWNISETYHHHRQSANKGQKEDHHHHQKDKRH